MDCKAQRKGVGKWEIATAFKYKKFIKKFESILEMFLKIDICLTHLVVILTLVKVGNAFTTFPFYYKHFHN